MIGTVPIPFKNGIKESVNSTPVNEKKGSEFYSLKLGYAENENKFFLERFTALTLKSKHEYFTAFVDDERNIYMSTFGILDLMGNKAVRLEKNNDGIEVIKYKNTFLLPEKTLRSDGFKKYLESLRYKDGEDKKNKLRMFDKIKRDGINLLKDYASTLDFSKAFIDTAAEKLLNYKGGLDEENRGEKHDDYRWVSILPNIKAKPIKFKLLQDQHISKRLRNGIFLLEHKISKDRYVAITDFVSLFDIKEVTLANRMRIDPLRFNLKIIRTTDRDQGRGFYVMDLQEFDLFMNKHFQDYFTKNNLVDNYVEVMKFFYKFNFENPSTKVIEDKIKTEEFIKEDVIESGLIEQAQKLLNQLKAIDVDKLVAENNKLREENALLKSQNKEMKSKFKHALTKELTKRIHTMSEDIVKDYL